ncbi:MAG: META domain-containing protein [Actinomycetota bacterium]|nr:META domain-containing protein [Actinomycetota bacterium]
MKANIRLPLLAALLLLAAVVLGGCSTSADPTVVQGTWVLESFGGTAELVSADPAVTTELTLKAGEATGNGGVNSFSGTYEVKDNGIDFGAIAATAMAGPPAAMDQEAKFLKALDDTRHFEINEDKLVLSDLGNNTVVVMVPR